MPHLKIRTRTAPRELFERLEPFTERDSLGTHKLLELFLDRDGKLLLLELLVAEGGSRPRHFFAALKERDDLLVLRCFPLTDPEKTDGVRRLLARTAARIIELCAEPELAGGTLEPEMASLAAEAGGDEAPV